MNLLKEIKDILQGWTNHLTNNESVKDSSEIKMEFCNKCPLNVNGICTSYKKAPVIKDFNYRGEDRKEGQMVEGCKCPLDKKTKSDSQCPRGFF